MELDYVNQDRVRRIQVLGEKLREARQRDVRNVTEEQKFRTAIRDLHFQAADQHEPSRPHVERYLKAEAKRQRKQALNARRQHGRIG